MELTSLPAERWAKVNADSKVFWDEMAPSSPRAGKVVEALKKYADPMDKMGHPYR